MIRRTCLLGALLAVAAAGTARAAEITIPGKYFDPPRATAVAGDQVTWRNQDLEAHDVRVAGGLADSGPLGRLAAFTHVFDEPDAYPYVCTLHPFMSGRVDVVAATLAAPPGALIAGELVTLTGRAPAGTAHVALERSANGGGWTLDGPGTVPAPDGTFTVSTAAVAGASYRVRAPLGTSPAVAPRVIGAVRVRLQVRRHRRRTVLRIDTTPATRGMTATLERYSRWHFRWRPTRRARLDGHGRTRFRLSGRRRGFARVALRHDAHAAAIAYSRTVRLGSGRPAHDPGLVGGHHELDPVADPELHEHARDVGLDGRVAHDQLPGDLRVREAARHELEHLELARRELVEMGVDFACRRGRLCVLHHADLLVDDGVTRIAKTRPPSVTVAPGA